jgi:hypothetical protein
LRSDHIKPNRGQVTDRLCVHREALKDQIAQELYQTDRQGKDPLLHVLFNTRSFIADDRFRRLVMRGPRALLYKECLAVPKAEKQIAQSIFTD